MLRELLVGGQGCDDSFSSSFRGAVAIGQAVQKGPLNWAKASPPTAGSWLKIPEPLGPPQTSCSTCVFGMPAASIRLSRVDHDASRSETRPSGLQKGGMVGDHTDSSRSEEQQVARSSSRQPTRQTAGFLRI